MVKDVFKNIFNEIQNNGRSVWMTFDIVLHVLENK